MVTWSMRLSSHRSWERTNQNCSADLKLFLCFHVCPLPASQTSKKKLHHVGRFVNGQELGDGCLCVPLMRQHGFSWPKRMRCISFPELVGDKPCMEGNRIVANGTSMTPHSSVPVLPTETTPVKKCERVTSGCSFNELNRRKEMWKDKSTFGEDVGYNFTFMSNMT